jgi:hypothetical protein
VARLVPVSAGPAISSVSAMMSAYFGLRHMAGFSVSKRSR